MKTLTITAIVAGLLVLPLLLHRQKVTVALPSGDERLYDVDDCIIE